MSEEAAEQLKVDFLSLSDDELPDFPPEDLDDLQPAAEAAEDDTTDEGDNDGDAEDDSTEAAGEDDGNVDGTTDDDDNGESDDDGNEEEEEGDEVEGEIEQEEIPEKDELEAKAPNKKSKKTKSDSKDKPTETEAIIVSTDDIVKQLFAPFRANGKDMQVTNIDDALTLMKMGANYNKKMAGLKPNMKLIKMLDNNKLLDEQKLSYLIDLSNKDPKAIHQLIKDSGLDPMEIDTDKPTEYTPNSYTVNDNEVALDLVLDDIAETKTFQETIDIISNKWDVTSKNVLLKNPNLIKDINDQVGNGIYKTIMNIVENEQAVGRLANLTDLEAYTEVGDALQAQGAFNQAAPAANVDKAPAVVPKANEDPKLKNRKKAAATTRSKSSKAQKIIDPLALSDDEFDKLAVPI